MEDEHRKVFGQAFKSIYKSGGWTIWADEMRYLADHLGMKKRLTLLYVAGRSNNISLIANTQRPAWVPLEAYSQAGHLILFRTGDERDLIRIGSLNGQDAKQVEKCKDSNKGRGAPGLAESDGEIGRKNFACKINQKKPKAENENNQTS